MKLNERIRYEEHNVANGGSRVSAELVKWLKELRELRRRIRSEDTAKKIANNLFIGGDGKKAQRLVLETQDNHFNGTSGWCYGAVCDVINKHLKGK